MNKFLFYFLSFTWGLPMTLIGLLVALVLLITKHKPEKYGCCLHFKVGDNWGGLNLGVVFLTDKTPDTSTKNHEHGHAIQNCYWGFLTPFVITIPSAIRYWYRELKYYKKGKTPPTEYDAFWVEADATSRGAEFMMNLRRRVI